MAASLTTPSAATGAGPVAPAAETVTPAALTGPRSVGRLEGDFAIFGLLRVGASGRSIMAHSSPHHDCRNQRHQRDYRRDQEDPDQDRGPLGRRPLLESLSDQAIVDRPIAQVGGNVLPVVP